MMYSAVPECAVPYSADGRDVRCYFDLIMDLEASLTLKIYVSTGSGYATLPTDALPNQPFRGVLKSFTFQRSIMQGDIGQFTTGTGRLVIDNADATYDFLPLSYAIDGRPITLKVGRRDASYDEAFTLARVTATGWNIDTDAITIDLVDFSYKLEVPLQPNVYGGTGGADGTADLTGKRKPLCLGKPRNVTAVLVVPSLLIYQVHDGSIQAIDAVYDKGAAVTAGSDYPTYAALAAAGITAGQYGTCKALGLFKLGIAANGQITADVQGENSAGFIETTADIVEWALINRTVLTAADLDAASFTAVNSAQPAPIDYFVSPDDNLTVAAFIQNIMSGIGGWGGHKLDGTFEVRIFGAPTGTPVARFNRGDMLGGDIKREPLPSAYQPPRYRWRVPYQRNWTVQTSDLAGGVTAARRAFLAEQVRLAEATSATIQTDHPFAQDRDPVQSYFRSQSDAATEAARLIDLFKTTRAIYRATVPRKALRRDVGDEIEITHPRFDLSQGRAMILVETAVNVVVADGVIDSVEVAAYG
ncbi:hypothetical protein JQ574_22745 [Bradyrhizobium sp. AUGA SZCCT0158]|uniref:hypothetical protein n=1 Tax=Bradyrhizobium sp. AUGA SZCCT0158 TaxID=2807661 RepID=UPI001BA9155D|nr:hypothetical protein [Bradyrhizobium sp. AUGA SZCCT0158]MBR1198819.1 hypothetical protein [Bradyrhizobium sp. AUGA SZCCT0158]